MQKEYQRFTQWLIQHLGYVSRLQQSMRRLPIQTSRYNQFQGKVEQNGVGKINSEVTLAINECIGLNASITSETAESLGPSLGSEACALIKASFISLIPDDENN